MNYLNLPTLVMPLLATAFISSIIANEAAEANYLLLLGIFRIYRRVWNGTINTMLALIISSILQSTISNSLDSIVSSPIYLWWLVDILLTILNQLLDKVFMVVLITSSSLLEDKQRLPINWVLVGNLSLACHSDLSS